MRKETSSFTSGSLGDGGTASTGFVVADLNAASAVSRALAVRLALRGGIMTFLPNELWSAASQHDPGSIIRKPGFSSRERNRKAAPPIPAQGPFRSRPTDERRDERRRRRFVPCSTARLSHLCVALQRAIRSGGIVSIERRNIVIRAAHAFEPSGSSHAVREQERCRAPSRASPCPV